MLSIFRSFYSVLLGYCAYYAFFFLVKELPDQLEIAEGHFDDLIVCYVNTTMNAIGLYLQNSGFPIICHLACIVLACLSISRGVSTIEPVNRIIVPTLLIIVVFTFYWALYLPYAGMGIIHMFTPSWSKSIYLDTLRNNYVDIIESFGDAELWRDALTQNAWDTGNSNI